MEAAERKSSCHSELCTLHSLPAVHCALAASLALTASHALCTRCKSCTHCQPCALCCATGKAQRDSLLAYRPRGVILDPLTSKWVPRPTEQLPSPDTLGLPPAAAPDDSAAAPPPSVDCRHLGPYPQRLWIDWLKEIKQ